jgi:hypothetical protein
MQFLSLTRWRWPLFFFLIFAVLAFPLFDHLRRAKEEFSVVEECKWTACFTWMKSAEVYLDTGVWLALKDKEGKVIPYECGSCADDIGHALFLSAVSKLLSIDLTLAHFAYFNAYINLLGMVILLLFFYQMRRILLYVTLLFMTSCYFLFFNGFYSPHFSGLGLAAFVFLFPLSLYAYRESWCKTPWTITFIGLGLILFSAATLMRGVYGYLGLGTTLTLLVLLLWENRSHFKKLAFLTTILFLTIGAWMSPKWVLDLRDHLFHFNQEENSHQKPIWEGPHGISHNLFIGLGIVPNKFGITYEDLEGYEFVKLIDPTVSYTSTRHYEILGTLYFHYFKTDPKEVFRIYVEKGKILFKFPPLLLSTLLFPLFLLIFSLYDRKRLFFFVLTFMGTGFFMLQGILAHIDKSYSFPATLFTFLQMGLILEFFVAKFKEKQLKVVSI